VKIVQNKQATRKQPAAAWKQHALRQLDELVRVSGFGSRDQYLTCWAQNKGFRSLHEFETELFRMAKEHLRSNRKIQAWSIGDWETMLRQTRTFHLPNKPAHQAPPAKTPIALLISQRLEELGKTQRWLAGELGVSRQAVHQYVLGGTIPRKTLFPRLKEILDLKEDQVPGSTNDRK
jgi:hypothetical protein